MLEKRAATQKSQEVSKVETLEDLVEVLPVTPSGPWTLNHEEPVYGSTGPDREKIVVSGEGLYNDEKQEFDYLPVSGYRVTVREDDRRDLYETVYSVLINGVEYKTRRTVISGLEEATEWAADLLTQAQALKDSGWVPIPPDNVCLNRWAAIDGSQTIALAQEDRDMYEKREYYLYEEATERSLVGSEIDFIERELRTDDLYESVLSAIGIGAF